MKITRVFVSLMLFLLLISCREEETATTSLQLEFHHQAGTKSFEYGRLYETAAGNSFSLRTWRTYISKIKLVKADGSMYEVPESYHLIEPLAEGAYSLLLDNIPQGEYESINFFIGVADEANLSEETVGDLDPSNNMAWNWTVGYKFIRMDGEFTDVSGNRRGVVVHIGTETNLKLQEFKFLSPLKLTSESEQLHFAVDLLEAFKNPHRIDFEVENDFQFNAEANLIGENYAAGYIRLTVNHHDH